jgi:hypothetical protein
MIDRASGIVGCIEKRQAQNVQSTKAVHLNSQT